MAEMDRYLMMMAEHGVSDLHFCTGRKPTFRKDGSIVRLREDILTEDTAKTRLFEIMPKHTQEEYNLTRDTDFSYDLSGYGRFRVNVYQDHRGICGVFRLIPSRVLTLEELQLPDTIKRFCTLSKGLVLVTGPTGSGKSTTLAAMIDYINKNRDEHIITIEDPVEFVHHDQRCLVNQREVGTNTASFKTALRAALREDPDIVLVGEMRDLETTHIAIETAETGHLVFGTRPDCIDEPILDYLEDLSRKYYIQVEYGIESCYDTTLDRINRQHHFDLGEQVIRKTHARGIKTGAHFIFGLPGETLEQMLASVDIISRLPLDTVKFHQLQIVIGTRMEEEFREKPSDFYPFSLDNYISFIVSFIGRMNPSIVIERFSGELPPRFMETTQWGLIRYDAVLRLIEKELERQNTWQGKYYM